MFPSLYEGFGLPVLEAMARGVPVACSDASSLPEVAGDAALLFDPHSERAIREAIERLLSDEALAARLRERGLARARRVHLAADRPAHARELRAGLGRARVQLEVGREQRQAGHVAEGDVRLPDRPARAPQRAVLDRQREHVAPPEVLDAKPAPRSSRTALRRS